MWHFLAVLLLPAAIAAIATYRIGVFTSRWFLRMAPFAVMTLLFGIVIANIEIKIWNWFELSPRLNGGESWQTALIYLAFLGPAIESLKFAILWWPSRSKIINGRRLGAFFGVWIAAAMTMSWLGVEIFYGFLVHPWTDPLVIGLSQILGTFIWGYAIGGRLRSFFFQWLLVTLANGYILLIAHGLDASRLALVIPVLAVQGAAVVVLHYRARRVALSPSLKILESTELLIRVPELLRSRHRVSLKWLVFGTMAQLGIVLVFLVSSVLLSNRLQFSLASIDEQSAGATSALLFLGSSVIAAYPIAGFLNARAFASTDINDAVTVGLFCSVLVAIGVAAISPIGLVFVLPAIPFALGLSCIGAWFGTIENR